MSVGNEERDMGESVSDEDRFVRRALARVEKAEKFQRFKQIGITILAFAAAFWWAFRPLSPELGVECTVLIGVGLIAAVCTAKIMHLINKNTKAVLQALIELRGRVKG